MYLKNLEIVGFKSFSDRSKLDFEPGITAVVGPNGCGKSNIIDAIRWCLGEMSVKSLRSNLMMDVVFNGSGSRPPQNMAEVTLTFDNSDKRLPIDFSEVAITRRLFRSGESEYFINKTQCRLRDIKELFLDTGMGEDGYSSMEQGKVEWILNAKPEERRELFEEAAGVSKYRARREEALRKLDRIEIDLSRLNDIISVTKEQIRKLENAVSRAKTYQRIREELKTMEISDWLWQLTHLNELTAALQNKLLESQTKAEALNTEMLTIEASIATQRIQLTETEEQLVKANQELASIDADVKIGEERLANAIQREKDLKLQLDNISQSIQREETRVLELVEQAEQQKIAVEQIKEKGASIETDYAAAVETHEATLKNLEEKKNSTKELRDQILDRAQERSRLQQQMSYLTSDLTRLESLAANLDKEKERIQNEKAAEVQHLAETEQQVATLRAQLAEKSAALESLQQEINKMNNEEETLRSGLMTLSEEIARLKGQIHSIEADQTQDPYLSGTQALLSSGLPGITGPLSRLMSVAESDQDLIASTIGEHLGDLVAETSSDADEAISFLAQTGKGRARIWILDKISSAGGPIGSVPMGDSLSRRIQCESQYRPLFNQLCANLWVQGTTIYGRAVINGGIDPAQWKSHVALRLPELQAILEKKEQAKSAAELELTAFTLRRADTISQKDLAVKEMEEARIRLELMQQGAEKIQKKIEHLDEENQVVQGEYHLAIQDKSKADESHKATQERFDLLQSQEQEDHHRLDLLHQETSELQLIHANANADLSSKKEKHLAFQEQLSWQTGVLTHTQEEIERLTKNLEHNRYSITSLGTEVGLSLKAQEDAKALVQSSLEKRQVSAQAAEDIQKKRVVLTEEIKATDANLHKIREEWNQVQQTVQEDKIQEASMGTRLESLVQKLFEQYEMNVETASQSFQPVQAVAEDLERLKKRVSGMGPINLAAPQEHAELLEKDTFMSTQQADLLKAKDDLREAITKINATTREHFKETFDKVRENFRTLYGQLFQGGEADIKLTDEGDILSAGIDIYCQPPGKKLLHISLLSGGEKALTACALLFAFFQVKPSPVALLDEVDAPLDEANVLRYVDMIKLFSQKSQFVMISHNKRTMEAANNLYGVTMEELGVSKVLSARLQKDKKKIEASLETQQPAAAL